MPETLPLTMLDAALRGMLVALLATVATVLVRDRPRHPAARAGVAMCGGLCVQAFASTPWIESSWPGPWQAPLVAVSVANVVLFWVFVQALFDDAFVFRPVHGVAWLAVAALSGCNCALGPHHEFASVTVGLQRAVPLLFAVLAAVAAASQWRADLVERRRRLRLFIVVLGVAYTLAMLVARLAAPQGRLSGVTATVDVAILVFMMAVVAVSVLRLGASELFPAQRPESASPFAGELSAVGPAEVPPGPQWAAPVPAPLPASPREHSAPAQPGDVPDVAEERLAAALSRAMVNERAYRTEDLTVAGLAAKLAVPEYRLRRHINQRLGHRNFNAYVNGLRLDDACAALADPARRDLPVLTIALEAGFQSIGPFNRAFKAATGLTPTEFRREKLADS